MDDKVKERTSKGLIQVYTGDGKGKTMAVLGLALRAVGQGRSYRHSVCKGDRTCGEHFLLPPL